MSEISDYLKEHRRRIVEREKAAFRELLTVYRNLKRELDADYRRIQTLIEDAVKSGVDVNESWVIKSRRLKSILSQIEEQIIRFGGRVAQITASEQTAAINMAADFANGSVRIISPASAGIGSLVPTAVITDAVGLMGDGSPIVKYFQSKFSGAAVEAIRSEIIKQIATGEGFRVVAKRIAEAGDITRSKALTVVRNEVNRVRRAATLERWRQNANITHWEWVANKSPRTCILCIAMDGTIFEIKEDFPTHINCRCLLRPIIKSVDLGPSELASEWFVAQEELRDKKLGPWASSLLARGEIELKDFVGFRDDKKFGRSMYRKRSGDVLAGKN